MNNKLKDCSHPRGMLIATRKGDIRCANCKELWLKEDNLIKIIEGMKIKEEDRNYYGEGHTTLTLLTLGGNSYNQALDDILTKIKNK